MKPELQNPVKEALQALSKSASASNHADERSSGLEHRTLDSVFAGPRGLRAGWSIFLFAAMFYLFRQIVGTIFFASGLIGESKGDSSTTVLLGELIPFVALFGATAFMGLIEGRRIVAYNLAGLHSARNFLSGLAAGFSALSLLVGALAWGGWLRFGAASYSGAQSLRLAAVWACAFLVVGFVEEGLFRCYALFTLARGVSFWWALAAEIAVCLYLLLSGGGHGAWGVYAAASLGLFPCLMLYRRSGARSAFWQAAWVTSTVFGLYHTSNGGENWIGVLAAAFIGFVFCVSVRLTGSAWWAIGCHAAWDWAETFFYGTADSGLQAQGHLLTTAPAGNAIWSGGSDGPEGSLLVLGVILLLLLMVLFLYGRSKARASGAPATPQTA
ncbi:MAG: CPBP family intramembrane glutamic endopeptidase [Terracidiphilus sp.]